MFCGKCGSNNPDGMAFCSTCGAPLGNQQAAAPEQPAPAAPEQPAAAPVQPEAPAAAPTQVVPDQQPMMNQQFGQPAQPAMGQFGQPAQPAMNQFGQPPYGQQPYAQGVSPLMGQSPADKKKSKTALIVAIILVVVLAAAACVVFFVWKPFGGASKGSPKGVVESFMGALVKGDAKKMKPCMAPYIEYEDADFEDAASAISMMEGMGVKISYKVGKYEAYDDDDYNDLCDTIEWQYDYDADKIQDAGEVEITLNIKGEVFGEKMDESEDGSVVVVKIGGKWYVTDMSGGF